MQPGNNNEKNLWQKPDDEANKPVSDFQGFDESQGFNFPETPVVDDEPEAISWQASDSIDHKRPIGWFIILVLSVIVLLLVAIFLLKDWFVAIVVILLGVAVGVIALRQPKVLNYTLDESSIKIGDKTYTYDQFQAFAIVTEENIPSIILMPSVRFSPTLTLYFDQKDGETIVDILSQHLPLQEHKMDPIDRLARRLKL